ncbi:MAG TPA: maleylpyruvate isomerase N-terminal domain-containing protein [Dehalococcoidia bacterium]|nr:maleylpyruvate isomerase N-terminal domain-containing protein [Dehalococcoidia bacterium]
MAKDDLLKTLDREFQGLLDAVAGLSDEQMLAVWYGDWSVRDILAHITGWHLEMDGVLAHIARGERPIPEGVDYSDADAWNARFADTWRHASPTAVVEELRASKEAFAAAARQVPDDRFEEGRAAYRILHNAGIDHYREHAPAIREWRQREGI